LSSVFFFLTLNLQQAQGYMAFTAGLAQMPSSLSLILLSRTAGKLTDRIGPIPLMVAGVLLNCLGFFLLSRIGIDVNYWTTFFPALLVFGIGLGLMVVPLTVVALGALPSRYSGIASGLNNAASRVAQMSAVAATGGALAVFGAMMVGGFRAARRRIARTSALPLDDAARAQLAADARNLGATRPPAGLSPETALATQTAIRFAFVDGFRQIMLISMGLALVGLAVMLALVRYEPIREPAITEAAPSAAEV
jgi:MFS family permease